MMGKSNYKILVTFYRIRSSGKNYAVLLYNFIIPIIYWCILFNFGSEKYFVTYLDGTYCKDFALEAKNKSIKLTGLLTLRNEK
jgi:hypothetical protein